MTEEKISAIIRDYQNPEIKVSDIIAKYRLNGTNLMRILKDNNIPLRCPNKAGTRTKNRIKKCPECYRTFDIKGARFCPYCGADVRSEKDLIIEKINKLFSTLTLLPESQRDEAQKIIKEIDEYIKRKDF